MGLGTGTKEEALCLPYITEKNSQEISLTWQNRRLALVLKISDFFFFFTRDQPNGITWKHS